MADLKEWLTNLKTEQPGKSDFITKLESFISDAGFNASKFEKAVESGLKKIENEVIKSFNKEANAQNKEDNN